MLRNKQTDGGVTLTTTLVEPLLAAQSHNGYHLWIFSCLANCGPTGFPACGSKMESFFIIKKKVAHIIGFNMPWMMNLFPSVWLSWEGFSHWHWCMLGFFRTRKLWDFIYWLFSVVWDTSVLVFYPKIFFCWIKKEAFLLVMSPVLYLLSALL